MLSLQASIHPLQLALDTIVKWSVEWQLTTKCTCKRLSSSSAPSCTPKYTINDTPLTVSNHVKDLGIVIGNHLSYCDHISEITSKASQRVGILFRGFLTTDLKLLRRAFITIRPSNSWVWYSTVESHIKKSISIRIENVQRQFSKGFLKFLIYHILSDSSVLISKR